MKTRSRRRPTTLSGSESTTAAWLSPQAIPGADTAREFIETATDSNQKQWAVWKHKAGPVFQIWYSKRRLKKGVWNPAAQLVPVDGVQEISFAITTDNVKLLAWQEFHAGAPKRVAYAEFATRTPTPLFYFPNTDGKADAYPRVAGSADGTRHVVWAHGDQIVYAKSPDGKKWQMENVTRVGFTRPQLAIDESTGLVYLGYLMIEGKQLFYSNRALNGGTWSAPKLVGVGEDLNIAARNGKVLISWGNNNLGQDRRMAFRLLENGRLSKVQFPSGVRFSGYAPHGVIDSQGNPHVIWSQSITGREEYDIYYSDFADGVWSDAQPLQVTVGNDAGNDLAIDAFDGLHAVYLTKNPTEVAFSIDRPSVLPPDTLVDEDS